MDSTLNSQQLVRLLAEESRRKVVAALVLSDGPQAATELASVTDLDLRQVVDAADRLVSGGLVQQSSGIYELDDAAFQHAARSEAPAVAPTAYGDKPADVARVLDLAFKDGRWCSGPRNTPRG